MPGRSKLNVGKRPLVAKTCMTCRKLKLASEFRKMAQGIWMSACLACDREAARKATLAANTDSQQKAHKTGSVWTEEEMNRLIKLKNEGKTGREIAEALQRSITSVYVMSSRLNKLGEA